ncbi:MAG: hypothetical protein ACJAYY_002169 [Paraglaciecola sp.]|jgi:hypothetical protein
MMKINILKIDIFKINVEITRPIRILLGVLDAANNLAIQIIFL